jgi:hypothetical protein
MAARPRMLTVAHGSRLELIATAMRTAHQDSAPLARVAMMIKTAFGGIAEFRKWAASHCDVARLLGTRMGLSAQVQQALRHLYERWDGNGMPGDLRGTQIPLAVRLMQVAQDADVAWQYGGTALIGPTLARRAGSGLDPEAVRIFLSLGDHPYKGLDAPSVWAGAMAAEPGPQPEITEARLDACLSAIADFADLKSMWTAGHSRGVADLAERAAGVAGLAATEVVALRRAALVHDIGRVAVPVSVWAKPGPLTRGEHEQVRLHAYHSERVLDVCPALRPLARLAGSHGERCDGSGYHRGSRAGDLPAAAWLLAAADCYQAMRERRAHRLALSPQAAADELSHEAVVVARRFTCLTGTGRYRRSIHRPPRGRMSRTASRRRASTASSGRQPRPSAITTVSPAPVNSHGAEVASVTRIPTAAEKASAAVIAWASMLPARKASGGHTTTPRSPLARV